ncbi:phage tail protein [Marivirga sp. S37H4]|uniref:Phage tail protein n=1 Tax=Marivirga aurantiaca TaxID=2802615 RepID=A0A934WXU1_9BACT|nr:phage tail protein [Marivirga aurantiaca]MBK6265139.1 phage tail protein [Marivirga aurantiaca]
MAPSSSNRGQSGTEPYYPMVGFYFSVHIDGIDNSIDSKFKEVSGVTMELESGLSVKEGGENEAVHELPGRTKYSDLVLKRGLLKPNTELTDWCMSFFKNDFAVPLKKKDISVKLLNDRGEPMFTWLFKSAQPLKMEISGFNSTGSGDAGIVVETITLKYETFTIL